MILFFQSWVPNVEISYLEQDFNFDIFRFKTFYEPGFWFQPNHQLGYQIHYESRLASEWTNLRDRYNLIKIFSLKILLSKLAVHDGRPVLGDPFL